MIFPNKLNIGDTIGIIAPSSPFTRYDLKDIEKVFNAVGYNVKFGKTCSEAYGYLAGSDELRARDIEEMFLDEEVNAIICMKGGYGTPRILNLIDYEIIKQNPKIFVGYSDITALHIAFNQKCDLATFHGIMAGTSPTWDMFTYKSLFNAMNMDNIFSVKNPNNKPIHTLVEGNCEGELIGGNLSLISATIGTPYEIDTKGKILFIEEIKEYTYKVDKMLTQLALAGKFDDCVGVILGDFCECEPEHENDLTLDEVFRDIVVRYNKPTIYNLQSGHCIPMITLPFGVNCKLDATNQTVEFSK